MISEKKTNINFFNRFFEHSKIPWPYQTISYSSDRDILFTENQDHCRIIKKGIYSFRLIPEYFKLTLKDNLRLKVIQQSNKGYAIDLSKTNNVNTYVKQQFKGDSKNIIKRVNRLNSCFHISYKVHYEHITKIEYEFLMNSLKFMLTKRFEERNDKNENLINWNELNTNIYPLLKTKRASLSVIYDNKKPIQITLAYHFQNIMFSSIPAYDIDYSKYGLGNIAIYKQIEWCINNDIKIIDMGYGDLEYKRRWSNDIYNFKHHVISCNPNNFIKINIVCHLIKFKEYLKKTGFKDRYDKWISLLEKKPNYKISIHKTSYEIIDPHKIDRMKENKRIDLNMEEYAFLRKSVYDFIYIQIEHISNIKVYELEKNKYYLVNGNKKSLYISFKTPK